MITLADNVGLVAFDVGARGGIGQDLFPLAKAVDYYGFEPDPKECEQLNQEKNNSPWKSITYLPIALAQESCELNLNLYRQRGCSSALKAIKESGELFSRGEYYIYDGSIRVKAQNLDTVTQSEPILNPAFLKIDVQGMEADIFKGAEKNLGQSIVGIRTEASFFPMYEGQPLFAELDQILRPFGFVPMRWLELHEWRRNTRLKYPDLSKDELICSRGQIIHGDVLYLLHPEILNDGTDAELKRLVRLGLISSVYGHLDHAYAVFSRPRVYQFVKDTTNFEPLVELIKLSRLMAKQSRWERIIKLSTRLFRRISSK